MTYWYEPNFLRSDPLMPKMMRGFYSNPFGLPVGLRRIGGRYPDKFYLKVVAASK